VATNTFSTAARQSALRYEALVHARSNLHLRARVDQDGFTPGASLFLNAAITEYGQPLQGAATVRVTLTEPDGTRRQWVMTREAQGAYEAEVMATKSGAHRFRIQAAGLTAAGHPFTREQLLTALIGHKTDDPTGGGTSGGGGGTPGGGGLPGDFCRLMTCLSKHQAVDQRFLKWLSDHGIDGRSAARCLRDYCDKNTPGGGSSSGENGPC
jgi:hypothetical protein